MEILRTITLYTQSKAMPFLVIGGHAINSYGLARHTGDLDLLVPLSQKQAWLDLMSQLRYSVGQNTDAFARFRPDTIAAWPIDLMFVGDSTFSRMNVDPFYAEFGAIKAPVANIKDLIALKIHAMKTYQEHRDAKDFSDLLYLLKKSKLSDTELAQLCDRHATKALFNRITGATIRG